MMMIWQWRTVVLVSGAAVAAAIAAGPVAAQQPVTREQAVAAALERGPRLALARTDTAVATALIRTARAWENPALSAEYTKSTPQIHAILDVPIDVPWLRSPRISAARLADSASRYSFALERAAVRLDAEAAYVRALAAQAHARLSRRTAEDADSLHQMAIVRREAGDAGDLEVELAAVIAGQFANAAEDDSVAAMAALLDLQMVMGMRGDSVSITLADTLALPDESAPPAPGTTLAVATAAAALQSSEAALTLEQNRVFAAPSLQLGFETHDPSGSEPGFLPVIGLSLPLPLFNANGGAKALAAASRDRAQAELDLARRESDAAVARASRERAIALAKARRDARLLAGADRVATLSLEAYREGAVALPAVLEANRAAREALARYVDEVAAAAIADAALRFVTVSSLEQP